MATKKTWEQQILRQIEENRKVTYLGAAHPELSPEEHPNFKVFEFTPNKSLDGDERYYLAGPEWSIMQQSSLLKANHDMLGRRIGYTLDFEEWFSYFEYEFITAIAPRHRPPKNQWKPWGKDVKQRPKKKNLTDKKESARKGFMVIQFWSDRTIENDSKRLMGTPTQLMMLLMNEMQTPQTEVEVYGIPIATHQSKVKFQPQIKLKFLQDLEAVEGDFSPVDGEITVRVENETNNTITEAKALPLANKVKSIFAANNGYVWRKGKTMITYNSSEPHYKLQLLCRDEASGRELITQVLSLQNHTPDWENMKVIQTAEATKAYPTTPQTQKIYGENRKLPRRRPIADVRFRRAELHVWGRPEPVILIDRWSRSKRALVAAN